MCNIHILSNNHPTTYTFQKLPSGTGMVVLASNCVWFQYTRAVIDTISHSTQALPPPVTLRMVDTGRAAIAGVCQHKSNQLFIATMGWLKRSAVRVVQRLATGLAHRLFNTTPHKNGSNKPTVYHGGSEALEIIVAKGAFEGFGALQALNGSGKRCLVISSINTLYPTK